MKKYFAKRLICFALTLAAVLSLLPAGAFAEPVTYAAELSTENRSITPPAISAPFTTHPSVFMVEDDYQIIFATDVTGMAWVEISGVKYEDASAGLMNWNSTYHKITVPRSALDAAEAYTVCFRSLANRPTSKPAPGSTESRTYPFVPVKEGKEPVFLCVSDQHGSIENPTAVAAHQDYDVLVFGGDYASKLNADSDVKLMLDMVGELSQGVKPVIYSRGNHEVRGPVSHELHKVSPSSETTGVYYTVTLPGVYAIVLDGGEDKEDSHADYGGTVDFEAYRAQQTQWLQDLADSGEWKNYPVRVAICHIPFTFYNRAAYKEEYKKWTELLDQMGVSLLISGHTHTNGIYDPASSNHKSDPDFTVLVVTDKDNGDITYSGSFVTIKESAIAVKTVQSDGTVKSQSTVPYVAAPATASRNISEEAAIAETVSARQTRAATELSSPFTSHPAVFAVEDGYQIVFSTEKTGMSWVEVGGKPYRDSTTGLMDWASKYHKITVPASALDAAKSYTICFQAMSTRAAYKPVHEDTVSRDYSFRPMSDSKNPTILCLSDCRGLSTYTTDISQCKSFDALYFGGDYCYNGNSEENVSSLLSICGDITGGSVPIIYTRGNREIRGAYAYLLDEIAPYHPETGSYYVAKLNDIYAIVLDSGEDKVDSHSDYGGTVVYEKHRDAQTAWLQQLYESGEWENYPTRVAFCHVPVTMDSTFKKTYAQWTELLNKMGISLMISGHKYTQSLYAPSDSNHVSEPSFAVLVSCDVDNSDYHYSGSYVKINNNTITVENVSAEKELLSTATTPNLTAAKENDFLFFDFTAEDDYDGKEYGEWEYNCDNRWASNKSTNTIAIDTATGVLSLTRPEYANVNRIYAETWNGDNSETPYTLSFDPKNAEYLQVRMKISGFDAAISDTRFCLNFYADGATTSQNNAASHSFPVGYTFDGSYITLKLKIADKFRNATKINGIQLNFWGLPGAGTVVFDYVYIGPESGLPGQENLYFDFKNDDAARQRYHSDTYGGDQNFDTAYNWEGTWISSGVTDAVSVNNDQGTISLTKTNENTKTWIYLKNKKHLRYRPEQAEYLQVRLSISGFDAAGTNTSFELLYYTNGQSTQYDGAAVYKFEKGFVFEGEYLTLTVPLAAAFRQNEFISQMKLNFWNLGGTGKVLVDYLYIGTEGGLPEKDYLRFGYVSSEEQAIVAQQNCLIVPGVTESTLKFNDEAQSNPAVGFLTTIEPNAEVTFKASYSGYYAEGSTAQSRAALAPNLLWKLERPTSQAAAYEKATGDKVLLATNADFYDVKTYQPAGYLIMEGNVLQTYGNRQQPFFAVLKDGSFAIRDFGAPTADVEEAVSGVWLVRDGKNVTDTYIHAESYRSNNPMNAIGITADGTIHIFVIDGRQESYSMGMDANDLSDLFVSLGCVSALDLDGGGSATYASVHEGTSTLRLRNSPSDTAGERAIADALLLVSTAGQCQHDYSKNYVINNDGTHTVSCSLCGSKITSGHLYTDGLCACTDVEEQPDHLYFGFTNDATARKRYLNSAYGYWNFDNVKGDPWSNNTNWAVANNDTLRHAYQIDHTQGVLIAEVTDDADSRLIAPTKAYKNFPWFNESGYKLYPLSFVSENAAYFQIRFKTENCSPADGKTPKIKLHYYYLEDETNGRTIDTPVEIRLNNDAYQILTLPIPATVREADVLTNFVVEFIGITAAEGGNISVDYFYIGPEEKLPTKRHTVTFTDSKGNVLQTGLVYHGEDATAPAEAPTKAADAESHYTFSGWDKSLSNITDDTVITACFTAQAHIWNEAVVDVPPTCTEEGSKSRACSVCDFTKTEILAALGHEYIAFVVAPTCTERGFTLWGCTCGDSYQDNFAEPLGHSYGYENNGENHNVTCANCDYAAIEDHNYVDGSCICGAVENTEPTLDSTLSFGAQLYLENDLTMAFRVKGSKLANYDVSTAYLVVEREIYESGAKEAFVETMTISEYTVSADGRYVFSYPGIAAAQMNDAIRATLYIKDANGKEYVSPVLHTSVATYLDGLLSNSTSDTKLVTLILDMVNYGAAAQVYFDRHADAPVNEAFESFKTYASYASADFITILEDLSGTTANEGATGKLNQGLDLGTRIGIQYKVTLPNGINAEDAQLVITDANGNILETIEVSTGTVDSKGRYIVNFYGSTSKDMRRVVYATAYANGTAITGTCAYSISTYAWGIQENASAMDANLVAVTRMMMLYGDSASAYFAN